MEHTTLGPFTTSKVFDNTQSLDFIDDRFSTNILTSADIILLEQSSAYFTQSVGVIESHILLNDSILPISEPFSTANSLQNPTELTGTLYPLSIGNSDLEDSLLIRNRSLQSQTSVNLTTKENNSQLIGTPNDDRLRSRGKGNVLKGKAGDDQLFAKRKDKALGNGGSDTLRSKGSKNILKGGGGSDEIFANQNDKIFGNSGSDTLWSGNKNNKIKGGGGADQFWIASQRLPKRANTIQDFKPGLDIIGLNNVEVAQSFDDLELRQKNKNTLILITGKRIAILENILPDQLSFEDFVFNPEPQTAISLNTTTSNITSLDVDSTPPTVTAFLAIDTGDSISDGITSNPTITGTITDESTIASLQVGFQDTPIDNYLDITSSLSGDGQFSLNRTLLEQLQGGFLADGSYSLNLISTDEFGNQSDLFNLSFTLDTISPELGITSNLEGTSLTVDSRLQGSVTDAGSDITVLRYKLGDSSEISVLVDENGAFDASFNLNNLVVGQQPLSITAVDKAGNTSITSFNVRIEPIDFGGLRVISPFDQSNVGGIYVNGAEQALQSLGQVSGIAIDNDTSAVILFSKEENSKNVSPLRLDDIVTIFRSVYEEYGALAPYVSIDPNPSGPENDFIVVHDDLTDDTYIGWSLFESDRIMKTYTLGKDNVTGQPFTSLVPGYKNLLDPDFIDPSQNNGEVVSERFWLSPGEVNRSQSSDGNVTFLDVFMSVNTARNGQPGDSSVGATYFANWFTDNFDAIAEEVQLIPPTSTGITGSVSPFFEAERMVVIANIAQLLQEQNIFMPDWMQEHEIVPVPVPDTTPQISVTGGAEDTEITIYGGATLIGEPGSIANNALNAEVFINKLFDTAKTQPLLTPFSFIDEGIIYDAIALPTDDTQVAGGHKLREVDLEIITPSGQTLVLERFHHSYFPNPVDSEFASWTFDMLTLREELSTGDGFSTYQLTTPLKAQEVRFTVDTDGASTPDKDGFSPILIGNDMRIGLNTHLIQTPDGKNLHFDSSSGQLLGEVDGEFAKIYKRNLQGQVVTIEIRDSNNIRQASININYDANGKVLSAVGSNGVTVSYSYNTSGLLESVSRADGPSVYEYDSNNLLTSIEKSNNNFSVFFEYDNQGNVLQERLNDIESRTYDSTRVVS